MHRMNLNKLPTRTRQGQSEVPAASDAIQFAKLRAQGFSLATISKMMKAGTLHCSNNTVN